MDKKVRADTDGTLYLADYWPEPPKVQQKSHGLIYYAILFSLVLFRLGCLVAAFFVFFLVLAFL
jgi:hypothetical protein